jgi:hypothetical protein
MTLQDKPSAVGKLSVIGLFAAIFAGCYLLPDEHKHLVPLCNIPLIVLSRVPQIITNARNGHTGQVRAIAVIHSLLKKYFIITCAFILVSTCAQCGITCTAKLLCGVYL